MTSRPTWRRSSQTSSLAGARRFIGCRSLLADFCRLRSSQLAVQQRVDAPRPRRGMLATGRNRRMQVTLLAELALAAATFVAADAIAAVTRACTRGTWFICATLAAATIVVDFVARGGADVDPLAIVGLWIVVGPFFIAMASVDVVRRLASRAAGNRMREYFFAVCIGAIAVLLAVGREHSALRWPRVIALALLSGYEAALFVVSRFGRREPPALSATGTARLTLVAVPSLPFGNYAVLAIRIGPQRTVVVCGSLLSGVRRLRALAVRIGLETSGYRWTQRVLTNVRVPTDGR
jgi:hypothetical protein